MDSGILFDFSAGIATVTLHNPGKLNAVNAEMWRGLSAAMQRVADDPQVVQGWSDTADDAFSYLTGELKDVHLRVPKVGQDASTMGLDVAESGV